MWWHQEGCQRKPGRGPSATSSWPPAGAWAGPTCLQGLWTGGGAAPSVHSPQVGALGQGHLLGLRVLNRWPALIAPSSDAALSEWNVLCPLFPSYAPAGRV